MSSAGRQRKRLAAWPPAPIDVYGGQTGADTPGAQRVLSRAGAAALPAVLAIVRRRVVLQLHHQAIVQSGADEREHGQLAVVRASRCNRQQNARGRGSRASARKRAGCHLMQTGTTRPVNPFPNLIDVVPVVLFYATAVTDRRGRALFSEDIYRRDAKLIRALGTG